MKSLLRTTIGLVFSFIILLIGAGCSDFLDQKDPNRVLTDEYFSNENDVSRALNGVYQSLRSGYLLGESNLDRTEERSDNMGRLDNQSASGDPFQFTNFTLLPSNPYLRNHWVAHQVAINRANFVLQGLEEVDFADPNLKEKYRSEALFLRALVYFEAVRKWGDLPLVTRFLKSTDQVDERTSRVGKQEIYEQIVSDLKQSLEGPLSDFPSISEQGKASKAAVSALLGKVYLTMYTDEDLETTLADLQEAKKYLLLSWGMKPFDSLSQIAYSDVFRVDTQDGCGEIIFEIPYIQGDKDYHSSVARNNQPAGSHLLSLYKSKGDGRFVNPDLVKEYEPGDLRREWSVQDSPNVSTKTYFISKFRDTSESAGSLGYGGNDWIVMRYADVALLLSEVEYYLGDSAQSIKYLDMVRQRAGLPSYEKSIRTPGYRVLCPTLKFAILHERRVELAFECQRWYDLLRFFSHQELVDYMHAKSQDDYGISDLNNFGLKDVLYPIPFDEVKIDPVRMYQNDGY